MRLDPGAEFSGFTIERTLGTGGMGVVYLARNPRLNRLVALKVLGELIATDTRGRARFEREAALAARLEHPNIVAIYDRAASDAELPWISMKFVGGGDVAQRMTERGGPLPDDHAVRILTDAARALDYAHRHGILHRDVKPGNILLDHDPAHPGTDRHRAVLTDFGIARALDDTLTLTGTAATFAYAAPERFHGATADHRADIYSLGCTFYELLTARQPFPRTDQAAVIAAHLNTAPPRPTDVRPELPPGINDVIAIALAKNPTDRYPTCAALAEAATQILTRSRPAPANPRTAPTLAAPPHPELIETLPATSSPTPANLLPPTSDPGLPTARADESPISPPSSADPDALTGIPESIRVALDSPHPEIRRGAVQALSSRLASTDESQSGAARKALHHIATHDNPAVSSYAREVLGGASTMDSPRLPRSRPAHDTKFLAAPPPATEARSTNDRSRASNDAPSHRALGSKPNAARGSQRTRWATLLPVVAGALALVGAGLLIVSLRTPPAAFGYNGEYPVDPLGYEGRYYVVTLAVGAALAGAVALLPRLRRDVSSGALMGFAVVGTWATVVLVALGGRLNGPIFEGLQEVRTGIGYTLLLCGHLAIVAAGLCAIPAWWMNHRGVGGIRLPSDPLSSAAVPLAVCCAAAIGFTHSQSGGFAFLRDDYTWVTVSAAATAAVPMAMAFIGSRRLAGAVTIGWALGGAAMGCFFHSVGQPLDTWSGEPDGSNGSTVAVAVFVAGLVALVLVTVLAMRRKASR